MNRSSKLSVHLTMMLLTTALLSTSACAETKDGTQFGDWVYECNTNAAKKTNCVLSQTIVNKKEKRRLIKLSLSNPGNKGGAMLATLVPLGVHIPSGVSFAVDKGKTHPLNLQTCTQHGCIATTKLNDELLKSMKNGGKLTIKFAAQPSKTLSLDASLKGITDGLKSINISK